MSNCFNCWKHYIFAANISHSFKIKTLLQTPCETNTANMLLSRKTVEEEIQYITETYSRDEKYAIFKYLKDTLFAP